MEPSELNRRDFNRLAMAAFGGALAGSTVACSPSPAPAPAPAKPAAGAAGGSADEELLAKSVAAVGVEKHVCRGLNACKNQGGDRKGGIGENACAGQGNCATVALHACSGQNDCKGQGGCGETGVENDCKGKGGCHLPLMDDVWAKARKTFELKMKKQGTEFGAAPAKA